MSTAPGHGHYVALGLVAALAGCAAPGPAPEAPQEPSAIPERPAAKPSRRAQRYLKALQNPPLQVAADCRFVDPDGYQGRLKLAVDQAQVRRFEAEIAIPGKGACRFDLNNFRQTATQPTVTLQSRQGDCIVHMWQQGGQVTVGFGKCRRECGGNARDYLWPILVDTRRGRCS